MTAVHLYRHLYPHDEHRHNQCYLRLRRWRQRDLQHHWYDLHVVARPNVDVTSTTTAIAKITHSAKSHLRHTKNTLGWVNQQDGKKNSKIIDDTQSFVYLLQNTHVYLARSVDHRPRFMYRSIDTALVECSHTHLHISIYLVAFIKYIVVTTTTTTIESSNLNCWPLLISTSIILIRPDKYLYISSLYSFYHWNLSFSNTRHISQI